MILLHLSQVRCKRYPKKYPQVLLLVINRVCYFLSPIIVLVNAYATCVLLYVSAKVYFTCIGKTVIELKTVTNSTYVFYNTITLLNFQVLLNRYQHLHYTCACMKNTLAICKLKIKIFLSLINGDCFMPYKHLF